MSVTKQYLDYLDAEVGIAPASSQEELDCAQTIAEVYSAHGLEPQVQDFVAPKWGYLPYGVVMIALFLGVFLVGLGGGVTTFIGFVLTAAAIALLAMTYTGRDVIGKVGPSDHSQNVVGFHAAEGENVSRNRPIVIVAHYDTQRIDLLSRPGVAPAKKLIATASPYLVCAVALCAFIQILGFLPEAARRTFWVIGIVASLPMLAWGVNLIAGRFMPYAAGGVDNKSSLAAMLGVLDRVCPADGSMPVHKHVEADVEAVQDSAVKPSRREPVMREEREEVVGTRHGEAVIRALGILPADCDITYIEPEVRYVPVEEPVEAEPEVSEAGATADLSDVAEAAEAEELGATADLSAVANEGEEADPGATMPMQVISGEKLDTEGTFVTDPATLSQFESGESADEGPLMDGDASGLDAMAEESDEEAAEAERPTRTAPAAVSDPTWGQSTYQPKKTSQPAHPAAGNIARRAALFDLPDPMVADPDPLAPEPQPTQLPPRSQMAQLLADASANVKGSAAPVRLDGDPDATKFVSSAKAAPASDIHVLNAPAAAPVAEPAPAPEPAKKRGLGGIFGKKKRQQQESMSEWLGVDENYDAKQSGEGIGSWDNFNNDDMNHHGGGWKGGAALNINLRGLKDKVNGLVGNGVAEINKADYADDEPAADLPMQELQGATTVMNADELEATGMAMPETPAAPAAAPAVEEGYVPDAYNPEPPLPEVSDEPVAGSDNDEALEGNDLRNAILAMGDDDLRAHDIWFVATGASGRNHAGIKDFVAQNRKSLRGAFVINLENVGAGDLAMLTNEGLGAPRRADRRLSSLLGSVASDLHLNLAKVSRPWADTEATPLMRKHLRGVTIMGLGEGELPAFSHTALDVIENVDGEQVEDVCALVMEAIRRS